MKIEKITDNKIRAILKEEDFKKSSKDLHTALLNPQYVQDMILNILDEAKLAFNFDIDGYKLLIESFSSDENNYVFTITKYKSKTKLENVNIKKINKVKTNKKINKKNYTIFQFEDFDTFCNLCQFLKNKNLNNIKSSLYLYNNTYYLLVLNIDKFINSIILEFAKPVYYSKIFDAKLKEHGKIIIKSNAISNGIKYFAK